MVPLQVSCMWYGGGWRGVEVWDISMGTGRQLAWQVSQVSAEEGQTLGSDWSQGSSQQVLLWPGK